MIPCYLKSAVNVNNSTDTNQTTKTSPTLHRPTHSVSSGNLARSTTSFKSFKNLQQSCRRSHTNSHTDNMDKILGTSLEIIENNLTIQSKSNELIDVFNTKTKEITEAMQSLHFSTIDLRNKLSRGHITNNGPIIAQVTQQATMSPQKLGWRFIPPAQSCWCEIRGHLHKEMNLHIKALSFDTLSTAVSGQLLFIKASYYEALSKNNMYPP